MKVLRKRKCKQCLQSANWCGGVLQCSKCGQMIALRYRIGEEVCIYIFEKFKQNRKEIEEREDTFKITKVGNLLGDINFSEFDLLYNIRSDEKNVLPIQNDEEWNCEDSEREDTSGIICDNELKLDTY